MAFALRLTRSFRASPFAAWLPARKKTRFDEAGTAAIEFAIIGPVLVLLLMGVFTYGGYFLTAQTIQQMANDAARASIAGLDDDERQLLAEDSIRAGLSAQAFMRGDLAAVDVTRAGQTLAINVTYDASEDVYWAFQTLIPVPPSLISRTATIRLGGF